MVRLGLIVVVAAAVAASVVVLDQAGSFKVQPSPFEIAVPLKSIQGLSLERGLPPADVLRRFAAAGATAVVLEERTLSDLALLGGLSVVKGDDADRLTDRFPGLGAWRAAAPGVPATLFLTRDPALAAWAAERAEARFGRDRVALFRGPESSEAPADEGAPFGKEPPATLVVAVRGNLPSYTRLGFYPPDIALARSLGLRLVLEVHNPREQPGYRLARTLEPLGPAPGDVSAVLMLDSEVWGQGLPGGPAQAGRDLAARGLPFALDPDRTPAGAAELARAAGWRGIGVQEIWTTWRPELYAEGVVERQAPLLVVMPGFFSAYGGDPAWPDRAVSALAAFRDQLAADRGLSPGRPSTATVGRPAPGWTVLIAWGVLAAAALALLDLLHIGRATEGPLPSEAAEGPLPPEATEGPLPPGAVAAAGGVVLALVAAVAVARLLSSGSRTLTVQALALVAALVFPVEALIGPVKIWSARRAPSSRPDGVPGRDRSWIWPAVRETVRVAVVSLAGGLIIRALGVDPGAALKLFVFRGTKLALLAGPVAGVLLWWLAGTARRTRWRDLGRSALDLLRADLTVGLVVAAAIVGLAALYYVSRSGNNPVAPVSDLEFRLRRYLLEFFVVRPRTKEFAVGYPAVVLGTWAVVGGRLHLSTRVRNYVAAVAAGLAGVAASSVLNTFSHFHIPAVISLERTAIGAGLGLLVGLAAAAAAAAAAGPAELVRRRSVPRAELPPAGRGARPRTATAAAAVLVLTLALATVLSPGLVSGNPDRRPVELTVDLGALGGAVWDFAALARAGVTSVAVGETTVGELEARGSARVAAGQDLQTRELAGDAAPDEAAVVRATGFDPTATYVFVGGAASGTTPGGPASDQVGDIVARLLAAAPDRSAVFARLPSAVVVKCTYPAYVVRSLGLGFVPELVRSNLEPLAAAAPGLKVAPRPANAPGGSPQALAAKLDELAGVLAGLHLSWSTVVFQGGEVGGYPGSTGQAAAVLRQRGLTVGLILAPDRRGYLGQAGTPQLAEALGYRYARVLTVDTSLPPAEAARRVATRDAEMVYVRAGPAAESGGGSPAGSAGGSAAGGRAAPGRTEAWLEELARDLAALRRAPGPAPANAVAYRLPDGLASGLRFWAVLVLVAVLTPAAGAVLALDSAAGTAAKETARPPAKQATWTAARAGLTAAAAAELALAASAVGGLAARALFSDARIVLEQIPVSFPPALVLAAAVSAALAAAVSAVLAATGFGAGPRRPLTLVGVTEFLGLTALGYWLAQRTVSGGGPPLTGALVAAIAGGAALAGLAAGFTGARVRKGGRFPGPPGPAGPASPPGAAAPAGPPEAAAGLAYAGSLLAYSVAASAGRIGSGTARPATLAVLAWVAGWAAGWGAGWALGSAAGRTVGRAAGRLADLTAEPSGQGASGAPDEGGDSGDRG